MVTKWYHQWSCTPSCSPNLLFLLFCWLFSWTSFSHLVSECLVVQGLHAVHLETRQQKKSFSTLSSCKNQGFEFHWTHLVHISIYGRNSTRKRLRHIDGCCTSQQTAAVATCTKPSQNQAGQHSSTDGDKASPVDEVLLAANGCQGRENQYSSGLWAQVGWPYSSGWLHTHAHFGCTNFGLSGLKNEKKKEGCPGDSSKCYKLLLLPLVTPQWWKISPYCWRYHAVQTWSQSSLIWNWPESLLLKD